MKSYYDELNDKYPDYIVLVKIGRLYVVHGRGADVIHRILGYAIYQDGNFGRAASGPDVDKITNALADNGYGYIVWDRGKIVKRFLPSRIVDETLDFVKNLPPNVVRLESDVMVEIDGKPVPFKIVKPNEIKSFQGIISYESPIGKALVGHPVGATVVAKTPTGDLPMKIISLKN